MTTTPPATAGPARTRAAGRLGQGELRRKVAGWLAANPGAWKPGKIAGALGHSAGAVGNALATLEARGEAAREPGRPVRYRANAATAGAATAPARAAAAPRPARHPGAGRRHRAGGHLALAGREPGPGRPAGADPAGRAGHAAERAGVPAQEPGRHARRGRAAQPARRRHPGTAVRAAGHGQDIAGRGGVR